MQRLLITFAVNRLDTMVVIYPGYNGTADGFNGKYVQIAGMLCERGIAGAVVRTDNLDVPGEDYSRAVKTRLRLTIRRALKTSREKCGYDFPKIYLMGVSAGASAAAAIAYEFPQVKKMLLIAPSSDAGDKSVEDGLSRYKGKLFIAVGGNDDVVPPRSCLNLSKLAGRAEAVNFAVVPNCDHRFQGERNGRIFSKALLWAFAGDTTFPNPEGGIKLYD